MGIFGHSMSLNKKDYFTEGDSYDEFYCEAMVVSESVVFNEFLNHKSMLESFIGSYEERKTLEEKCDILLEISFKDIKQKIIELLERAKKFVREIGHKIKAFFTQEKKKQMEKELSELRSKVKNLESDLDSEKEAHRKTAEDMSQEKERLEKARKDDRDEFDRINTANKEKISSLNSKLAEEIAKTTKMYNGIIDQIDDPILRFNMYNYVENNLDPTKYLNSSKFSSFMDSFNVTRYVKMDNSDLEEIKRNTAIFNKETMKKITSHIYMSKNDGKTDKLKDGGYNHRAVNMFMKNELDRISKEKNPLANKSINDCLRYLENCVEEGTRNVSHCIKITSNYEQVISSLQKKIASKEFKNQNITHHDAESGNIVRGNMEFAQFVVGHIKDQIQTIAVISSYEGKKAGMAYSITKWWNSTFGTGRFV